MNATSCGWERSRTWETICDVPEGPGTAAQPELRDSIGKRVRVYSDNYPDFPAVGELRHVGDDEMMGMGGFSIEVQIHRWSSRIIPLYNIVFFEVMAT